MMISVIRTRKKKQAEIKKIVILRTRMLRTMVRRKKKVATNVTVTAVIVSVSETTTRIVAGTGEKEAETEGAGMVEMMEVKAQLPSLSVIYHSISGSFCGFRCKMLPRDAPAFNISFLMIFSTHDTVGQMMFDK
jgi:hypothetical protein